MTPASRARGAAIPLLLAVAACGGPPDASTAEPGAPIPGLTDAERARFQAGHDLFNTVFGPERGLGPAFNENQCSACHTFPASGGVGGERVSRGTSFDAAAGCDPRAAHGGLNVRRKLTPPAAAAGLAVESLPPGAVLGRFTAPALYGMGLVEAVPQETLDRLADPDDADGDGISGRVGRSADGRPARFGRKADVATLADFVGTALFFEMGLTSAAHPRDEVQGRPAPPGSDAGPDPEIDAETAARLLDYVRMLAPPPRGAPPSPWSAEAVVRGEQTFARIGCAACHRPFLDTGPDSVAALSRRRARLYSDLLLHDMGPALADVCGPGAAPSEVRTEPLIGLRFRDLLLHDGRTVDPSQAILLHGGEAGAARDAFAALKERERLELLAFLKTL